MGANSEIEKPVLFFDGVCNLCNASVQFIIKRNKKASLRFASLQSDAAKEKLPPHLVIDNDLQSLVLLEEEKVYTRSTAALRVARRLSGLWPLLYGFIVIPKCIRDAIYDWIARNRYEWFGKKDQCMIPSAELKSRFLE